jgi:hypothetical protein
MFSFQIGENLYFLSIKFFNIDAPQHPWAPKSMIY